MREPLSPAIVGSEFEFELLPFSLQKLKPSNSVILFLEVLIIALQVRPFSFFTDRARSVTRAHLVSLVLLCPNTCRPHMYCMKYCYNNYIINIIHRLCNTQARNAYTHALAYR